MPRRFLASPRRLAWLGLLGASALAGAPPPAAAARASGVETRLACLSRGPCQVADSLAAIARPGGALPLVATNFGLLSPAASGAGFDFTCEEQIGARVHERMTADARGRIFVPGGDGLYFSDDGCAWSRARGAIDGEPVFDVAFDPEVPGRVWALGGADPRLLALSTDGGASFAVKRAFPGLRFLQVAVAPRDARSVYLAGYAAGVPFVFAASTDGGDSFSIDNPAWPFLAPNQLVELLGVAPDDPATLYFALRGEADEIWKSTERGRSPAKVLALDGSEYKYGFAFGGAPGTLFVAGRDLFRDAGRPPAQLYVTRDAGRTWEKRPSGSRGPRYRCLAFSGGTLYACGGDTLDGDEFLLGASGDEGRTWKAVAGMKDIVGARACAAPACRATSQWLCDSYGACAGLPDAGAGDVRRDSRRPDAADAGPGAGGCACAIGGSGRRGAASSWAGWLGGAGVLLVVAARHRSGPAPAPGRSPGSRASDPAHRPRGGTEAA